jgi:hypothetical protein
MILMLLTLNLSQADLNALRTQESGLRAVEGSLQACLYNNYTSRYL